MNPQNTNGAIQRRELPAELLNELFASISLKNAFDILAKMPNGLLARNVRRMLNNVKKAMESNKWNAEDCAANLEISENGIDLIHCGLAHEICSVRAILPIPIFKFNTRNSYIAYYFEVEILIKLFNFGIGFCCKEFPCGGRSCGFENNSIGIRNNYGIWIDGNIIFYGNYKGVYKEGDVIGLGLIHCPASSSLQCFSTCNGELMGKVELPVKYFDFRLFPAVNIMKPGDSIRANFGSDEWLFNPQKLIHHHQ